MKVSKANDKKVKTETIETDETSARPDVPEFLLGSESSSDTSKSHIDPQELKDLVSVCLSVVVYIHETLTILTEYEGWTLSEADKALWENVLKFLLKDIHIEYLPQIIAVIGLAMMEFTKVFGYMRWRKTNSVGQEVPTAKTGFIDAPVS